MTDIKYPQVIVVGRAEGWDEDAIEIYSNVTTSEAEDLFRDNCAVNCDFKNYDEMKNSDSIYKEIFINVVATCHSKVTINTCNY